MSGSRADDVNDRQVDLVVVGDGPAGSALAAACVARGVDALLVGPDIAWTSTYATWSDDLDAVEGIDTEVFAMSLDSVAVHTDRSRELHRRYAVFDNEVLQRRLRTGVRHLTDKVVTVTAGRSGRRRVILAGDSDVEARLVVDAAGWPSMLVPAVRGHAPAWQTALGVVLAEPPRGDLGRPTWMDFRPVAATAPDRRRSTIGPTDVATFCYSLPVRDGWLVEETVLAARPAVEPIALLPRLAARLGRHPDDLLAEAVRTEYVRIPMGGEPTPPGPNALTFGAAAGYVHPATGFSVTASLRAAGRVADAVADALGTTTSHPLDMESVVDAVWPEAFRRTRLLHDYGLDTLLRLDDDETRQFFGAFFDLPEEQWAAYLRLDTPPIELARVMARLFRSSSWSLRRRLMSGNPAALARLARP